MHTCPKCHAAFEGTANRPRDISWKSLFTRPPSLFPLGEDIESFWIHPRFKKEHQTCPRCSPCRHFLVWLLAASAILARFPIEAGHRGQECSLRAVVACCKESSSEMACCKTSIRFSKSTGGSDPSSDVLAATRPAISRPRRSV